MVTTVVATITALVRADSRVVEGRAFVDGEQRERRIIGYPALTGPLVVGDTVRLNITATQLALGTGGYDFVVANLSQIDAQTFGEPDGTEHIIKLRYTPHQVAVRAIEMDAMFASVPISSADTLDQIPVVVCELHSQVAIVCAGIKAAQSRLKVVYVYTDTAALPCVFSRLVDQLKRNELIDCVITTGQAFGGDFEAVNVPSALISAKKFLGADIIVIGQGPGNAGTGTPLGFGGLEQGTNLDLVSALGGNSIAVLRVSDGDDRERHRGISHHSITVLERIVARPTIVALPSGEKWIDHREAVRSSPFADSHRLSEGDGNAGVLLLEEHGIRVTTMGRGANDDPAFFAFAAAAGDVAVNLMNTHRVDG